MNLLSLDIESLCFAMRSLLPTVGTLVRCVFLSLALVTSSHPCEAADATPDSEGYIRNWIMLAPLSLPEGEPCAEALLKDQIRNEAALRPKAGDRLRVGDKELTWRAVTAATNYFDFNETLKSSNDHVAGYLVTYIECDQEIRDVVLSVASNDQGRIYFNGIDIYAFTEARPLMLDADKGRVTLKKGTNVIIFKVLNEQNSWQAAMRLSTKAGAPLQGIRVRQTP